jgi:hypothetical protein
MPLIMVGYGNYS